MGESEAATSWCLSPPLLSLPGAHPLLSSSVSGLWSLGCCGSGVGWDGGGEGCSGVELGWGGQGHCRRSSVSDRENAITTSSAPENQQQNVRLVLQTRFIQMTQTEIFTQNALLQH